MRIKVVTDETFRDHQGYDLFDPQKVTFEEEVNVNKADRLHDVLYRLSEKFKCNGIYLRIWPIKQRGNNSFRPSFLDTSGIWHEKIFEVADRKDPWIVYVEKPKFGIWGMSLGSFDRASQRLLFLKYYDPAQEIIQYMGHICISLYHYIFCQNSSILMEIMVERASLSKGTKLLVYEEVGPNHIKPSSSRINQDGNILIYQVDSYRLRERNCPYR